VDRIESCEEGPEIDANIRNGHLAEVLAEVGVLEVREDGDDLVGMSVGGDEGADRVAAAEVVEKVQLVEDARGAAGDVDLLYGDELRLSPFGF